jgi:hypothetical protein
MWKIKRTEGLAQVVELLPSKPRSLVQNPSMAKKPYKIVNKKLLKRSILTK